MRKTSERIKSFRGISLAIPLFTSLFSFIFNSPVYADSDEAFYASLTSEQREQKKQQLDKLRRQMSDLRSRLQEKQQEKNSAARMLKEIEVRIGERAYVLRKINRHLRKQERELDKLRREQRLTRTKLANQRSILSQQIRAAYMIGHQEYLKLLLNQESPAVIGRTLIYYDYFHKARSHYISDAISSIEALEKVTHQVKVKSEELTVSLKQQQAEKNRLDDDYIERATALKELEKDIAVKGDRLNKLMANEKILQQLLTEIQTIMPSQLTEIDKRETFALRRGRLKWPVDGKVNRLFGKSRQAANLTWNGVIIDSPEGKDVKAVSHGRVAYADWLRGYGMLIIVDHGDGFMTLYGHNQALYKETGDWVEEGEVISTVGQSGGETKSGLYFEVRVKGQPSNPVKWCHG